MSTVLRALRVALAGFVMVASALSGLAETKAKPAGTSIAQENKKASTLKPATRPATVRKPHLFDALRIGMMPDEVRAAIGAPAVATSSAWTYTGAGYVEFSASGRVGSIRPGEIYVPAHPVPATGGLALSPSSVRAAPSYSAPAQASSSYAAPRSNAALPKSNIVQVQSYQRSNGTVVKAHARTAPNSTKNDNFSTKGNVNPITGKAGTKPRDGEVGGTKKFAAQPEVPPAPRQRSHDELLATVRRCNGLLDSYVKAPFGQSPFNAERYEGIRKERDEAQAELNAGH